MSFLLRVRDVTKHYGPEPVLDGASLEVRAGERLALVGPNGAGKTTLLRILEGSLEPDSGAIARRSGATIGFLEQHAEFDPQDTVWSVAEQALAHWKQLAEQAEQAAHQLAAAEDPQQRARLAEQFDRLQHELQRHDAYHLDHKIARVLSGMGFDDDSLQQPARQLSGGQQSRLLLTRLLLAEPDLMLLDEPSNHLDIQATEWLESFLAECSSAVLVVSHDRYFLDKVAVRTLELCHGTIDSYAGNFTAYRRQKDERLEVQRRTYEKQQTEIAKMEDFVRRNRYGQKHAQAEDRRKKLERIERVPPPREIPTPVMGFPDAQRCGDVALRVEHLTKGFEAGSPLFEDLTLDILRGEKWGILGPNGSGKTTLLRCLLGELTPNEGRVLLGAGVRIGYFDQLLRCLPDDAPAVDAVRPGHKEFVEQQRRDLLARFGVTGDMVFQSVSSLSGGERNRTGLAMLAASDANLLVLDEPTNHLDLWSRGSLEASLRKFPGTVLLVSHDRYFLNQVADHLLVMEGDRCRIIEGDYDTYQHFVRQGLAGPQQPQQTADAKSGGRGEKRQQRSPPAARPRKFPYRKLPDIEQDIHNCEETIERLHQRLADPQVHRDGAEIKRLKTELDERQRALAELYEHWEEAAERA